MIDTRDATLILSAKDSTPDVKKVIENLEFAIGRIVIKTTKNKIIGKKVEVGGIKTMSKHALITGITGTGWMSIWTELLLEKGYEVIMD